MTAKGNQGSIPWLALALLFAGSRALIFTLAWLTPSVVEPGRFSHASESVLQSFIRWDVNWFLAIAAQGYQYAPGEQSSVAFFPLFPLLLRLVGYLTGGPEIAGFLISNGMLAISVVILWRLTNACVTLPGDRSGLDAGLLAVALLLFGPVSFFFSIPYSESTFLCLSLLSLYAANRRAWLLAGLAGFAAALTRNAGVLLVVPLLLQYFDVQWDRPRFSRQAAVLGAWPCLLPVAGLLVWAAYLYMTFGDPLIFTEVQKAWGRQLTWPWMSFGVAIMSPDVFYGRWFLGHALGGMTLFLLMIRMRMPLSLVAFSGLLLLLNVSAQHLEAIPRLLSVIFPFYMAVAMLARRWPAFGYVWLGSSAGLLALSVTLYVNDYWFT